ncbi:hypothetical protein D9611_011349 [Ephemerocybe angulata]|uniref:Uncharacterized protein n=1 Tax=Ephemerocybe angulata TaxID=980116 RepID=A0A8H5F1Y6_9AGAR|nr:hypothetical protein D9611_011349 [Tulosesus angulatus]
MLSRPTILSPTLAGHPSPRLLSPCPRSSGSEATPGMPVASRKAASGDSCGSLTHNETLPRLLQLVSHARRRHVARSFIRPSQDVRHHHRRRAGRRAQTGSPPTAHWHLARCSRRPPARLSNKGHTLTEPSPAAVQIVTDLAAEFPRTKAPKRLALNLSTGGEFETRAERSSGRFASSTSSSLPLRQGGLDS